MTPAMAPEESAPHRGALFGALRIHRKWARTGDMDGPSPQQSMMAIGPGEQSLGPWTLHGLWKIALNFTLGANEPAKVRTIRDSIANSTDNNASG